MRPEASLSRRLAFLRFQRFLRGLARGPGHALDRALILVGRQFTGITQRAQIIKQEALRIGLAAIVRTPPQCGHDDPADDRRGDKDAGPCQD